MATMHQKECVPTQMARIVQYNYHPPLSPQLKKQKIGLPAMSKATAMEKNAEKFQLEIQF